MFELMFFFFRNEKQTSPPLTEYMINVVSLLLPFSAPSSHSSWPWCYGCCMSYFISSHSSFPPLILCQYQRIPLYLSPPQVHFVDSILSNNSTDDHIREFVSQGGLTPLLRLLSLPSLPLDFPTSTACATVTGACKSILVRDQPSAVKTKIQLFWKRQ